MPTINPNTVVVVNPASSDHAMPVVIGLKIDPAGDVQVATPVPLLALQQRAAAQRRERERTVDSLVTAAAVSGAGVALSAGVALYRQLNPGISEQSIAGAQQDTATMDTALLSTAVVLGVTFFGSLQSAAQTLGNLGDQERQLRHYEEHGEIVPFANINQPPLEPLPLEEIVIHVEGVNGPSTAHAHQD